MKMAGCRWLIPPIQGNGWSAAAWRAASVPVCPGCPSLSQLSEAVPEAPWGEGRPPVTCGSGRVVGSSHSRAGPLQPVWVPDLRCVCGAPHNLPEGNWPPPCSREAGGDWIWCFEGDLPVLLGKLFGLWVRQAADVVVSVIPAVFQACCSASWLCTSASRTFLPQQVSSAPQGKCGGPVGSGAKAVWCNRDSVPVPSRLYSVGWSCTEESFLKVLTPEKPVLHMQCGWKGEGEAVVTSLHSAAAVACCL